MKKLLKDEDVKKLEPPKALLLKIDRNVTYIRKHGGDKDKEKGKKKKDLRFERKAY